MTPTDSAETPAFTRCGKQIFAHRQHYADAADPKAAEFTVAALNAHAAGGWQPIKTAPRDGSWFLTKNENYVNEYEVGYFNEYFWPAFEQIEGSDLFHKVDKLVSEFTHDNFCRATHSLAIPGASVPELAA